MTRGAHPRWDGTGQSAARHAERVARIEREIADAVPDGARVLDAGCGGGAIASVLARRGYRVTGLDVRPEAIERARQRAGDAVELVVGDVTALPFEAGSFNAALSVGVLGFLDAPERALEELARVVAPGGRLVVTLQMPQRLSAAVNPLAHAIRRRYWSVHTRAEALRLVSDEGFRVDRIVPSSFPTPVLFGVPVITRRADARLRERLEPLAEADRRIAHLLCGTWIVVATRI